eukprot:GHVT01079561.1.p3 GENE.GHVT01079561.1~~GHVT01079561.1.p3  ORF type:complete len:111 (-),score=32.22 GHVT01079561.1:169-501(-)
MMCTTHRSSPEVLGRGAVGRWEGADTATAADSSPAPSRDAAAQRTAAAAAGPIDSAGRRVEEEGPSAHNPLDEVWRAAIICTSASHFILTLLHQRMRMPRRQTPERQEVH